MYSLGSIVSMKVHTEVRYMHANQ